MSDLRCPACTADPSREPRGWSACFECRELREAEFRRARSFPKSKYIVMALAHDGWDVTEHLSHSEAIESFKQIRESTNRRVIFAYVMDESN